MRKLIPLLVVAGALALAPGDAQAAPHRTEAHAAVCGCSWQFMRTYNHYRSLRVRFFNVMRANWMPETVTRAVNKRIVTYVGWNSTADKDGFCKRHPRICAAAAACISAGGAAFANAKYAGKSDYQAGKEAVTYCVIAVTSVIWVV